MASVIYEGQRLRIDVQFRLQGVPKDPLIAQALIKAPSGTVTTLTYPAVSFTRKGLGEFEIYWTVNEPGTWFFRAEGSGVVDAVSELPVSVEVSAF